MKASAASQAQSPLFRHADLALGFLVLVIVGMMILPLPTWLLDLLLAANISFGVLMVLVSLYIKEPLAIASFPTLLLVTTLYRLALNVSSTRLILLQADAGHVISAFGNFVVRGNYVVGAVVFAILTLIQFLVIAKGSERVAEVGARFTLDAMPGKQMAIDAELRTGALSQDDARKKRNALQRESQFYGAMDGAMKFVKGDAIAGIVITAINIVGGLAIGVLQRDMAASQALRTYGLLTIGDGLVSQIPALLFSTAAGLVVTRVASDDESGSLGRDVVGQIFGISRAQIIAAVFCAILAVLPGLPAAPFLIIAALLGTSGVRLHRRQAQQSATARKPANTRPIAPNLMRAPIVVELGAPLDQSALQASIDALVQRLRDERGLPLAPVAIEQVNDAPAWRIRVFEVIAVQGTDANMNAITDALSQIYAKRTADFVGIEETQALVEALERVAPALVRQVTPKPISLALLADILRRLSEEGISLRPLRDIFETLAAQAQIERDPIVLTELVRAALRRQITQTHAPEGTLHAFLLDPEIEDAIRSAIQRTSTGTYLALAPDLARDIATRAKQVVTDAAQINAVILTQPDVRRYVRRLLDLDLPSTTVLAYAEVTPDTNIVPIARIAF